MRHREREGCSDGGVGAEGAPCARGEITPLPNTAGRAALNQHPKNSDFFSEDPCGLLIGLSFDNHLVTGDKGAAHPPPPPPTLPRPQQTLNSHTDCSPKVGAARGTRGSHLPRGAPCPCHGRNPALESAWKPGRGESGTGEEEGKEKSLCGASLCPSASEDGTVTARGSTVRFLRAERSSRGGVRERAELRRPKRPNGYQNAKGKSGCPRYWGGGRGVSGRGGMKNKNKIK